MKWKVSVKFSKDVSFDHSVNWIEVIAINNPLKYEIIIKKENVGC